MIKSEYSGGVGTKVEKMVNISWVEMQVFLLFLFKLNVCYVVNFSVFAKAEYYGNSQANVWLFFFCLDDLGQLFNLLAIQEVPRTCEYIAFHGKKDFADITKRKHPEIRRASWISLVGPISIQSQRETWLRKEGEREIWRCWIGTWRKIATAKECEWALETEKKQGVYSSSELPERNAAGWHILEPCWILIYLGRGY